MDMHTNTNDIVLLGSQLLVSYDKLRNLDRKVYDYIKMKVCKKAMSLQVLGGKKYVVYDERLKSHREKIGTKQSLLAEMEASLLASKQSADALQAMDFAASVQPKWSIYAECLQRLNEQETQQMMRLCGWLEAAQKALTPSPLTPKGGTDVNTSKKPPLGVGGLAILEMMQKEWATGKLYGKALSSVESLTEKIAVYQTQGWQGLVDGRKGNTNNAKFQDWHQAILYSLYCETQKLLPPTIYKTFCKTAHAALLQMDLVVKAKLNFRGQIIDNESRAMNEGSLYTKLEYVNRQTGEVIQIGDMVYDKFSQSYVYQPVDFETVRKFLTAKDFTRHADLHRHGTKYHLDKHSPFNRLLLPKHSLSLVTMDDYVNNFYLLKTIKNTTKASSDRLRTFTIWDTATDIPLGSAHGEGYKIELVFQAIYVAMLFIKSQTGNWLAPCEVEMERMFTQGSKKSTKEGDKRVESAFELELQQLFPYTTLRQTPQAKLTESRQNIAQNEFFRELEWYVGNNITSTKADSKANPEKANKGGVTAEQVAAKWVEYREFKCGQLHPKGKGQTRLAYFLANLQPKCPTLDDLAMVQLFAKYLGCVSNVSARQNEIMVKGNIYTLPMTTLIDDNFRQNKPADDFYQVKYLPHDLGQVYLFHPQSGRYLATCSEKPKAQRAKVEQTAHDKEILGLGAIELAQLKRYIANERAAYQATLESYNLTEILQTQNPVKKWQELPAIAENLVSEERDNWHGGIYDSTPSYDAVCHD